MLHVGTAALHLRCCGPGLGGHFQDPEGCFSYCLCKLGVLASVLAWKDVQLEGWRPVGANRGHRGHSYSKPWAPSSKVWAETGSCSWSRKGALVCLFLTKDTCSSAEQTSFSPPALLSRDYIFSLFMHNNRYYYICAAAHRSNIRCLFLISKPVPEYL